MKRAGWSIICALTLLVVPSGLALAQTTAINPLFRDSYSLTRLPPLPGVSMRTGGLAISPADPNTLLYVNDATAETAIISAVALTRDMDGHIVDLAPASRVVVPSLGRIRSLAYGPDGILFVTTSFSIIQLRFDAADLVLTKTTIVPASPPLESIAFVPDGFGDAGHLRITDWNNRWLDAALTADGSGFYDIGTTHVVATWNKFYSNAVYIESGNPLFPQRSVLFSQFSSLGPIDAFTLDSAGNPNPGSLRTFVDSALAPAGLMVDPVSGDVLTSSAGGWLWRIEGFAAIPEPSPIGLSLAISMVLVVLYPRRIRGELH